jgi:hypothetical protein
MLCFSIDSSIHFRTLCFNVAHWRALRLPQDLFDQNWKYCQHVFIKYGGSGRENTAIYSTTKKSVKGINCVVRSGKTYSHQGPSNEYCLLDGFGRSVSESTGIPRAIVAQSTVRIH